MVMMGLLIRNGVGRLPSDTMVRDVLLASFTAVRRAFLGLSKPSRCLFFAKNSLTDMSRCFAAIDSAVTALRFGCLPVSLTLGIFSVFFHFAAFPSAGWSAIRTLAANGL